MGKNCAAIPPSSLAGPTVGSKRPSISNRLKGPGLERQEDESPLAVTHFPGPLFLGLPPLSGFRARGPWPIIIYNVPALSMFGDFALSCDGPPGTSAEKNKNTHKEQSPLSVHHSPCLRISATAHYVLNVPFPPLQIPTGRSTHPECTMQVLYFGVYDQVRLALARPSKVRFHPDIVRSTEYTRWHG